MCYTSVTPQYFWYEMSFAELETIFESIKQTKRSEWERWRMQCYYAIRHILKDNTQPKDIIPLPWDDDKPNKKIKSADEQRAIFERMTGKRLGDV